MTYVVEKCTEPPYFLIANSEDNYQLRVPSVVRRSEISGVYRNGRALLEPAETPTSLTLERPCKRLLDIYI